MKQFYLAMCFIGTILPLSQLIIWVKENGLDFAALIGEIGQSRISMFGWYDVLVSAVVLFAFIIGLQFLEPAVLECRWGSHCFY